MTARVKKTVKAEKTQAVPTPIQREATPEEQAAIQVKQQRARAEVAVLKQRFAEVDVAKTIAEAERDQLIQQNQALHAQIAALGEEIIALKNPKDGASNKGAETEPAPEA